MSAYITATGSFLPGSPVPNEEIEDYIGKAGRSTSDLKAITLANCGIKTRHYAIDKNQPEYLNWLKAVNEQMKPKLDADEARIIGTM